LDGTVNFFHGFPQFCSCVACCRLPENRQLPADGNELLAAVEVSAVCAPVFGELYLATRGCGAALNGNAVACRDAQRLRDSIVALSFGKTEEGMAHMLEITGRLAPRVRKVRSWGCAGLDILQVAHGRLGALLYRGLHLWDIAAAGLILSEAGGHLQAQRRNGDRWDMVASVPGVRKELMALVGDLFHGLPGPSPEASLAEEPSPVSR
jgi:myo-inositol-1(or 4)-monophosphatase